MIRSARGSALFELLVIFPTIMGLVGSGLFLSYLMFAHFWVKLQLYESLICLYERTPQPTCKVQIQKNVHLALPLGNLVHLNIQMHPDRAFGEARFKISDSLEVNKRTTLFRQALKKGAL